MIRTIANDKLIAESLSNLDPLSLNFPHPEMSNTRSKAKVSDENTDSSASSPSQHPQYMSSPTLVPAKMEPTDVKSTLEPRTLELSIDEYAAIVAMRIPPLTVPIQNHQALSIFKVILITKTETKPFDLKQLLKDHFTMTSVLNKQRFEDLDRMLRSNGLHTMAIKTRHLPDYDEVKNPTGYVAAIRTKINDKLVITPADSLSNFEHDLNRLETVMHTAFDRALYHQSRGFITHDPVRMYTDLCVYFHGQDNHGINAARVALARSNPPYLFGPTSHSLKNISRTSSMLLRRQ